MQELKATEAVLDSYVNIRYILELGMQIFLKKLIKQTSHCNQIGPNSYKIHWST